MKCKICGFTIEEGQTTCPGCGTSVEELKNNNNIIFETNEEEPIPVVVPANEVPEEVTAEPVAETPEEVTAEPVAETPVEETAEPVAETPVEETAEPVAETPVEETAEPVTETPEEVTVAPVAETPEEVTVAPVAETPVEDTTIGANKADDTTNMEPLLDNPKDKPDNKKGNVIGLVIGIIIALLVICGGVFAYFHFIYASPLNVMTRISKNTITTINNSMSSQYFGLNGTVKVSYSGDNTYSFLNNMQLNYDIKSDTTTGNTLSNIGLVYDNDTISANLYASDNKLYISLNDIYDKYISVSTDALSSKTSTNSVDAGTILTHKKEVNTLINEVDKALLASIDSTKITKTYETISTSSGNKLAIKVEYVLTNEEIKALLTKEYTYLKNDTDAVNALATLLNVSTQEVKEQIDTNISNIDVKTTKLDIVLYTDILTNKIYKLNVVDTEDDNTVTANCTIDGDNYLLDLSTSDNSFHFTMNTANKNATYTIVSGTQQYVVTITYNKESLTSISYPDVTNAVDYNSLTTENVSEIETNLFKNPVVVKLLSLFYSGTLEEE